MLRHYKAQPDPLVHTSAMGLVLAHVGYGCDDPDEVIDVFEKAALEVERTKSNRKFIPFATGTTRDLFLPSHPSTHDARGGVVWTVCQDGCSRCSTIRRRRRSCCVFCDIHRL